MSFETVQERATFIHEFGESITLLPGDPGEVEIPVLWEKSFRVDQMVEGTGPGFTAIEADLEPVEHGDAIEKDGVEYSIVSMKPDGTGFVHVRLSED